MSDYTRTVAAGLAAAGDTVHVWCPSATGSVPEDPGVTVHRDLGALSPSDLWRTGQLLDRFPKPRHLLVQWVPHAYGFRSANIPFGFWIWNRALTHGDVLDLMIHEPYLPLPQKYVTHTALALAHRLMLAAVLQGARHVWTAIPAWEVCCRPYLFGRSTPFTWLPVVSNIDRNGRHGVELIRARYLNSHRKLIGHFGTCGGEIGSALRAVIPNVLRNRPECAVLMIGRDTHRIRQQLVDDNPWLEDCIHATGDLANADVSAHIAACDLMVQPYPDGASSRRGSLLAALAHGKATVTTAGHLTEALWHAGSGVVMAPAGNFGEIAARVENLLNNDNERARLADAALAMYDRHFTLSRLIQALRDSRS